MGKETLRKILGIVESVSLPAEKKIDRPPVNLAELGQSAQCMLGRCLGVGRLAHNRPPRGSKWAVARCGTQRYRHSGFLFAYLEIYKSKITLALGSKISNVRTTLEEELRKLEER